MPRDLSPRKSRRLRLSFLSESVAAEQPMMVVDVGANPVHTPPYAGLLAAGGCKVIGFEPQKEAFAKLKEDPSENEIYVNAAVGKPGKATLHIYPSDGFTSLYPLSAPSLAYLKRFERQLGRETRFEIKLSGIDQIKEISAIDLLKMDVQGAELAILKSGKKKLSKAIAVIPEVRFYRLYEDEPLLGDLDCALREQGFELHKFLSAKQIPLQNSQSRRLNPVPLRNQLVDGDAVYIRSMENIDDWSNDQIRHLAVAAGTVFDSQDLTLRCLDHLVNRGEIDAAMPRKYADLLSAEYHMTE